MILLSLIIIEGAEYHAQTSRFNTRKTFTLLRHIEMSMNFTIEVQISTH